MLFSQAQTEIELTAMNTTTASVGDRRSSGGSTAARRDWSPWQLLNLCSAEPELTRISGTPEDGDANDESDDVAVLRARLAEKDKIIQQKEAELTRLSTLRSGD